MKSLVVVTFWVGASLFTSLFAQNGSRSTGPAQVGAMRFGRVLTAASVRAWGSYVTRDEFTPGATVWLYAETYGTPRNGQVDVVFRFTVTDSEGGSAFNGTSEFKEATSSANWAAWRSFRLPARAPLGAYTARVEVLNRLTGDQGVKDVVFKVVSIATTLTVTAPPVARDPEEPEVTEPLSPGLEEGFALLGQRQYEDAVRVFRRALGKEKTSAIGWWGLARAYHGLSAYKNVLESCDKILECTQSPRFVATAHNLKGVALFARAKDHEPPVKADLVESEREFRAALAADAAFHAARFNLGVALLRGGDDEAGVEELRAYLAAAPTAASAKDAARMIDNPRRAREEYAPDFSLVTVEGEHFDLEGLQGKVVVLDFWASWCAPCVDAIGQLKTVRRRFTPDRVVMISISVDRDAAAWRAAMQREKMSWHQALDGSGSLAQRFGVLPIPCTFVLDSEGVIRKKVIGYTPSLAATLEDAINKALKAGGATRR